MGFIVNSLPDILKKADFCHICDDLMPAGGEFVFVRFGRARDAFAKAHISCVNESRDARSIHTGGMIVRWTTLPPEDAQNGNRYALYVNDIEVLRGPNKGRIEGMVEFLEKYPDSAKAALARATPEASQAESSYLRPSI